MTKPVQVYGFLSMIALLSWWLVEYTKKVETTRLAVPEHSADFFSIAYSKIEMNSEGLPENELVADKMTHFSDDKTTELLKPVMTFYSADKPPWIVRSETGWMSADHKDLRLNGKVFISHKGASGKRSMKVNTSNLRVKPELNYAETDAWAELITPSDWVSGTGMKVFFKEPIFLELLSNVRSRYET